MRQVFGAGGGNAAGDASISIGGGYTGPKTKANSDFAIAIGDNASATGKSSISMGYKGERRMDRFQLLLVKNRKSRKVKVLQLARALL